MEKPTERSGHFAVAHKESRWFRNKRFLSLFAVVAIAAAIPLTVFVAQQVQDFRQRAEGGVAATPAKAPSRHMYIGGTPTEGDDWTADADVIKMCEAAERNPCYPDFTVAVPAGWDGIQEATQLVSIGNRVWLRGGYQVLCSGASQCLQGRRYYINGETPGFNQVGRGQLWGALPDIQEMCLGAGRGIPECKPDIIAQVPTGWDGLSEPTQLIGIGKKFWLRSGIKTSGTTTYRHYFINGNERETVAPPTFQSGQIAGMVFNDANSNGQKDTNETGIQNIPLAIFNTTNGQSQTTTTDAQGHYRFLGNFQPGVQYRILINPPSGYTTTTPPQQQFSFPPSNVFNFGLRNPSAIPGSEVGPGALWSDDPSLWEMCQKYNAENPGQVDKSSSRDKCVPDLITQVPQGWDGLSEPTQLIGIHNNVWLRGPIKDGKRTYYIGADASDKTKPNGGKHWFDTDPQIAPMCQAVGYRDGNDCRPAFIDQYPAGWDGKDGNKDRYPSDTQLVAMRNGNNAKIWLRGSIYRATYATYDSGNTNQVNTIMANQKFYIRTTEAFATPAVQNVALLINNEPYWVGANKEWSNDTGLPAGKYTIQFAAGCDYSKGVQSTYGPGPDCSSTSVQYYTASHITVDAPNATPTPGIPGGLQITCSENHANLSWTTSSNAAPSQEYEVQYNGHFWRTTALTYAVPLDNNARQNANVNVRPVNTTSFANGTINCPAGEPRYTISGRFKQGNNPRPPTPPQLFYAKEGDTGSPGRIEINTDGTYIIVGLRPGTYLISYTVPTDGTYTATQNPVTVSNANVSNVNFEFTPARTQPNGTCAPSVTTATVGQAVTWTASNQTGGNGNYTYSWSGIDHPAANGNASITKTYTTPGTKTMTMRITSNGQFKDVQCTGTVTVGEEQSSPISCVVDWSITPKPNDATKLHIQVTQVSPTNSDNPIWKYVALHETTSGTQTPNHGGSSWSNNTASWDIPKQDSSTHRQFKLAVRDTDTYGDNVKLTGQTTPQIFCKDGSDSGNDYKEYPGTRVSVVKKFRFANNITLLGISPLGTIPGATPINPDRPVKIEIFDPANVAIATGTGTIRYNGENKRFGNPQGQIALSEGQTELAPGIIYTVKITTPRYLRKNVTTSLTITGNDSVIDLGNVTPIIGDTNGDNKIDIVDYNILKDCGALEALPAISPTPAVNSPKYASQACQAHKPANATEFTDAVKNADLNDDGGVNLTDFQWWYNSLSVQNGD